MEKNNELLKEVEYTMYQLTDFTNEIVSGNVIRLNNRTESELNTFVLFLSNSIENGLDAEKIYGLLMNVCKIDNEEKFILYFLEAILRSKYSKLQKVDKLEYITDICDILNCVTVTFEGKADHCFKMATVLENVMKVNVYDDNNMIEFISLIMPFTTHNLKQLKYSMSKLNDDYEGDRFKDYMETRIVPKLSIRDKFKYFLFKKTH